MPVVNRAASYGSTRAFSSNDGGGWGSRAARGSPGHSQSEDSGRHESSAKTTTVVATASPDDGVVVAPSPNSADGPGLDSGPILADFLAMGAGHMASPLRRPVLWLGNVRIGRPRSEQQPDAVGQPVDYTVNERRLVVAALSPSQPLEQENADIPAKMNLSKVPLRSREGIPSLFAQASVLYNRSSAQDASIEETGLKVANSSSSANRSALRPHRLRTLPWHREVLQKILCRTLLYLFVQDTRARLGEGSSSNRPVLWLWERRRAEEHADAGKVAELVKYLTETEYHMQLGPERSTRHPGTPVTRMDAERLRAERRQLDRRLDIQARNLEEDVVVRVMLDGCISWPQVRTLLGPPAALEEVAHWPPVE